MSYLRFDILQDATLLNYKHKTIPRFKDVERSCCDLLTSKHVLRELRIWLIDLFDALHDSYKHVQI